MKKITQVAAVAIALAVAGGARLEAQTAPAKAPWLHVRVEEPAKESKVHVNLPLTVVEAALALAPEKVISNGQIHLHDADHNLKIADMRKLWKELRAAGDAEIVSVQDKDETVSVRRQGDKVLVDVNKPSGKESVKVEVPVAVVDALFAGEGNELNVKGALAELQKLRGDIVRVNDKTTTVRVWIDEGN
jgi:hypothetical protein